MTQLPNILTFKPLMFQYKVSEALHLHCLAEALVQSNIRALVRSWFWLSIDMSYGCTEMPHMTILVCDLFKDSSSLLLLILRCILFNKEFIYLTVWGYSILSLAPYWMSRQNWHYKTGRWYAMLEINVQFLWKISTPFLIDLNFRPNIR